jgi:hypothetical protein
MRIHILFILQFYESPTSLQGGKWHELMPVFTVWLKPFYSLEDLSVYVLVTVYCVGNDLLPGYVACMKFC